MKRLRHKTESEVKNPRLLRQDRGLGQYMLGTLLRRVSPSILRLRCNRKDVNQTVESSCNKEVKEVRCLPISLHDAAWLIRNASDASERRYRSECGTERA